MTAAMYIPRLSLPSKRLFTHDERDETPVDAEAALRALQMLAVNDGSRSPEGRTTPALTPSTTPACKREEVGTGLPSTPLSSTPIEAAMGTLTAESDLDYFSRVFVGNGRSVTKHISLALEREQEKMAE